MRAAPFGHLVKLSVGHPAPNPQFLPQTRTFQLPSLASLSAPPGRTLTATRTLPLPPLPLFRTISAVESYAQFLPFLTASTVTARDRRTGYPTRAFLTVGYGPLSETFVSNVDCDVDRWMVGARSGKVLRAYGNEVREDKEGAEGELFEYLDTVWKLEPLGGGHREDSERTKVELQVRFRFRNAIHAAMMSATEDRVAGMMMDAFEKRVTEIEGMKGLR